MDTVGADRIRQIIHDRDPDVAAGPTSVRGMLANLAKMHHDRRAPAQRDARDDEASHVAPSRPRSVLDNVSNYVKAYHRRLCCTAPADDENRA
jgi:N-acetyl-gamma-glutamyl-phosphate reductase/acetylglutamate kinase